MLKDFSVGHCYLDDLRTFLTNNALINVMPAGGGGGGKAWGGDFNFFQNLQSNSLPTGK